MLFSTGLCIIWMALPLSEMDIVTRGPGNAIQVGNVN